jgi:hypothetical protein
MQITSGDEYKVKLKFLSVFITLKKNKSLLEVTTITDAFKQEETINQQLKCMVW